MPRDRSAHGGGDDDGTHVSRLLATLSPGLRSLFANAKALVLDMDGVLTDGRIHCRTDGTESVSFHVRDSSGVWQAHKAGLRIGLVTGRNTGIPEAFPKVFPFDARRSDALDKERALRDIADAWGIAPAEIAYVGDDLLDGPALRIAGLPIVVGDCDPDLLPLARYVTRRHGGCGAVREVTDLLLEARGARAAIVRERLGR